MTSITGTATRPAAASDDDNSRDHLLALLMRLGDDHLILGHRLSEWCGHCLLYTSPSPRD